MKTGTTLFHLKTDRADVFDGSTLGVSILATRNARRVAGGGLQLDRGVVELARNKALDELQAFTIEATITPQKIASERRNILEAVQVRNPDGKVSNARTASRPRVLELPFRYGVHNLSFENFKDGVPSWQTYEDTFGKAEVWHELLDPVFGHPLLTGAFFLFYDYFLKGEAKGGLATGFCTSLASLVADKFWKGEADATTVRTMEVRAFTVDRATNTPLRKQLPSISVPAQHDLVVAVPDWGTLNVNAQALAFE